MVSLNTDVERWLGTLTSEKNLVVMLWQGFIWVEINTLTMKYNQKQSK